MDNLRAKMGCAANFLQKKLTSPIKVGIILGTGLGNLADEIVERVVIPYREIPHFPQPTVEGHAGQLVCGQLAGKEVMAMQGRFHYYEGYTMREITFPVRVMWALGIRTLIITNAAGGINPNFIPGDLMIIRDHINLMGDNPLIGPNDQELGPRFPALTHAYCKDLQELALQKAREEGIEVKLGVYAAVTGPSLQTPAELNFLARIGADAVGMSTVPEVIVACHSGMRVLGISCITGIGGGHHWEKGDSKGIIAVAHKASGPLKRLLLAVLMEI